jgi:hypothetical protein
MLRILEKHASTTSWRSIGTRTYSLTSLNHALADSEAMSITKALVDPWHAP